MKLLPSGLLVGLLALGPSTATAQPQRLPMSLQAFESLDEFRPTADNWRIAGAAVADIETSRHLSTSAGVGVLVNLPSADARENLFTDWEHGDLELELEFMMPRGSNSGIYLQGRYEVQLLDSWGIANPSFADAGGIYERWDPNREEGRRGFEGHAPLMNAARAPGLWQHLHIRFQAPRFNDQGQKVANARMVRVVYNGVVIHENVELGGPTRAAAFSDESAQGPLMIQGDRGPVAIRNLLYKRYRTTPVSLSDTRYQYAEGSFETIPDLSTASGAAEGTSDGIDWRFAQANEYATSFQGAIEIPYAGLYRFELQLDWVTGDPHDQASPIGGGELRIGDTVALRHSGTKRTETGDIELEAGTYPFALSYFKNKGWGSRSVALFVEGGGLPRHTLNARGSLPDPPSVGSIFVEPTSEPALIRGFVRHDGRKKTHVIAAGHEEGVHYTLDLRQGALLQAWKGEFIETTDMWHSRGQEQLAAPLGAVLTFSGKPAIAHLADSLAAWPDSMGTDYTFNGYELDARGLPTFRYTVGGLVVSDRLLPKHGGKELLREITLSGSNAARGLWVRVAAGSDIVEVDDGRYTVDDQTYYVVLRDTGGQKARLRTGADGQELLVPVSLGDGPVSVRFGLVW